MVVDLQEAFSHTYDDCGFGNEIDYGKDPAAPVRAEVLARVAAIVRERRG